MTGKELGRYRTGPTSNGNPSRTTVDLNGDVWFGNRSTGTVVKIGLSEAEHYDDRNFNGTMETSTDQNNDGVIDSTEILPWWQDECVLFEVTTGGGPRGIAIDANNDLWAGTFNLAGGNKFLHIDGDLGTIIAADTIDLYGTNYAYRSYGAVVDGSGMLWSSALGAYVLKINPATKAITYVALTITSYGLGIDGSSLFVAGWGNNVNMAKINLSTNAVVYGNQGATYSRGVAVTADGDVWVVNSIATQVTRLDNNLAFKATIDIGSTGFSTGVAVDAAGKVWACNYDDGYLHRIDPSTDTIDSSVQTPAISGVAGEVGQHYSYSDMTGIVSGSITTKTGTWTVDFDSGSAGVPWGKVSWNSLEPAGTSVTVRVRSSDDLSTWSAWEAATSGVDLSTSDGRYLQIETKLRIFFQRRPGMKIAVGDP